MKVFLKKALLFIVIPIISLGVIEAMLPITFFAFRHFEAVRFETNVPHKTSMYPNISSSMLAVGDLCHHTKYAVIKKEIWKTDKLGYRNDTFYASPDVLIIGDSFTMGSGLSQEETLSSKLESKSNNKLKVYNMATTTMSEFDKQLKLGVINKPKLLIFEVCERVNPAPLVKYHEEKYFKLENAIDDLFSIGNLNVYLDKALKQFSIKWVRARLHNQVGVGVRSVGGSNMYFLLNGEENHMVGEFDREVKTVVSYKKYCDSLGIKFLFLPLPNKETLYYERVPYVKQPDYLFQLDSVLTTFNVPTVNSLKIYNDYRKTHDSILYHLDDTHWNPNGVDVIANELITKYFPHENILP